MKTSTVLVAALFVVSASFSQDLSFKGPVAYFEVAGAAFGTYNISLEHLLFSRSKLHCNARLGFGYLDSYDKVDYRIPAGINLYYGQKNSHPELGLHFTYSNSDIAHLNPTRALYFVPTASYRFQKPAGGFFFRVGYAAVFKLKEYSDASNWINLSPFHHSFGLALGYYFGRKGK